MPSRITDDVIGRLRGGDHEAFALVYQELAPLVIGYVRSRGVSDAEAVNNEVFIGVLKQAAGLTGGPAGLRSLVFSIAHARAVDELRSRSRRPEQLSYEPALDRRSSESAEQVAASTLNTDQIARLLDRLPDDQRTVVSLRVIADLSIAQVAELIGRSPGSVKQLQRRGLLALRELLVHPDVTPQPRPSMTELL